METATQAGDTAECQCTTVSHSLTDLLIYITVVKKPTSLWHWCIQLVLSYTQICWCSVLLIFYFLKHVPQM